MSLDRSTQPPTPVAPLPAADPFAGEMRRFYARTAGSLSELERARRHLPAGVCSNFRMMDPHPLFLRSARGSRVLDVDGHEYIDWGLAQSTLLAGHAHPAVIEAVRRQVGSGTMTCYPHPRTADLAALVCERFRLDLVRFVNTGSEATQFAVRVARAATGRDSVLKFDACYHGNGPEFWLGKPETDLPPGAPEWMGQEIYSAGIPRALVSKTCLAEYNDLESVRAAFHEHPGEIAALILEPVVFNLGVLLPRQGFLQGVRDLCDREGAVLIYDEVKMGCKLGLLGAGEYFGVRAGLEAHVVTAGASGSMFFSRGPVHGVADFKRTRLDKWQRFWIGMLNRGVLPQAQGPEDIWTVSVQHSDDDVETTLRAFREVAPLLA